jgi:hypothetical protein
MRVMDLKIVFRPTTDALSSVSIDDLSSDFAPDVRIQIFRIFRRHSADHPVGSFALRTETIGREFGEDVPIVLFFFAKQFA